MTVPRVTDNELRELQYDLLKNPEFGVVVRGLGGTRKVRIALPGTGKSDGVRVMYLDVPIKERLFFLMAYPKSKQDNLNNEQKAQIKDLVQRLKKEC